MSRTLSFQQTVISAHDKTGEFTRMAAYVDFENIKFDFPKTYVKAIVFENDKRNIRKGHAHELIVLIGYIINGLDFEDKKYIPVHPKSLQPLSIKEIFSDNIGIGVGGDSGAIDVLLKWIDGEEYIAISCKYDAAGWDGCDGDKLKRGCEGLNLKSYKLFACTKEKFRTDRNPEKRFHHTIIIEDIVKLYESIHDYLIKNGGKFSNHIVGRSPIVERGPEQRYTINETLRLSNDGAVEIWWNVFCRFGKTKMSLLASALMKARSILFITPFPTNCSPDIERDVKSSEYHANFNFIDLDTKGMKFAVENQISNPFFFVSTQMLVRMATSNPKLLSYFFTKYSFDFVIRDEAHRNDTKDFDDIKTVIRRNFWLNMTGTLDAENLEDIETNGHPVIAISYTDCLYIRDHGNHPKIPIIDYLKSGEKIEDFFNDVNFPNQSLHSLNLDDEKYADYIASGYGDDMMTGAKLTSNKKLISRLINELLGGTVIPADDRQFIPIEFTRRYYHNDGSVVGVYVNRNEEANNFINALKDCAKNPKFEYADAHMKTYNTETGNLREDMTVINSREESQVLAFTGQGRESTTITKMTNNVIIGDTSSYVRLLQTIQRTVNRLTERKERSCLLVTTGMLFIDAIKGMAMAETSNFSDLSEKERLDIFFNAYTIHKNGELACLDAKSFMSYEHEVTEANIKRDMKKIFGVNGIDISDLNFDGCFDGKVPKMGAAPHGFGKKTLGKSSRSKLVSDTPKSKDGDVGVDESEEDDNIDTDESRKLAIVTSIYRTLTMTYITEEVL